MATRSMQTIFEKNRYDFSIVKKSKTWFDQQSAILTGRGINPARILNDRKNTVSSKITPGNLYMFLYDPKYAESLPYYDRFPLVFPWRATPDGFIGLNVHYLHYALRVKLMDKLLEHATTPNITSDTKLKISWQILDGMSKFAPAAPCIKQYLNNHVRSQFIKIDPVDWPTAMMLPVEQFAGAGKNTVWRASRRAIK